MITPGPWEVDKEGRAFVINPQIHSGDANDGFYGGELIAESIFNPDDRKLIAAAPDLLAACKALVGACEGWMADPVPCLEAARAAIAKAEGK